MQSELEGVDNENVGFYGRCVLHATYPTDESACDANNIGKSCPGENEESCARTEVFCPLTEDSSFYPLLPFLFFALKFGRRGWGRGCGQGKGGFGKGNGICLKLNFDCDNDIMIFLNFGQGLQGSQKGWLLA